MGILSVLRSQYVHTMLGNSVYTYQSNFLVSWSWQILQLSIMDAPHCCIFWIWQLFCWRLCPFQAAQSMNGHLACLMSSNTLEPPYHKCFFFWSCDVVTWKDVLDQSCDLVWLQYNPLKARGIQVNVMTGNYLHAVLVLSVSIKFS